MEKQTLYRTIQVAERLPESDGFYFVIMDGRNANNWFKNGKWLDAIMKEGESGVTAWLEPFETIVVEPDLIEDVKDLCKGVMDRLGSLLREDCEPFPTFNNLAVMASDLQQKIKRNEKQNK